MKHYLIHGSSFLTSIANYMFLDSFCRHVSFFALCVFVFVVIDGSSSDTLRKLSDDSSRKHLSGEFRFVYYVC